MFNGMYKKNFISPKVRICTTLVKKESFFGSTDPKLLISWKRSKHNLKDYQKEFKLKEYMSVS